MLFRYIKTMRYIHIFTVLFIITFTIHSEISFEPMSLDKDNNFIFKSKEMLGDKPYANTFFKGKFYNNTKEFKSLTYYPEKVIYDKSNTLLYLQNRIGVYNFDYVNNSITEMKKIPGFSSGNEYSVYDLSIVSISPDGNYIVYKKPVSPMRSDIFLYNLKNEKNERVVINADRSPGETTALWAPDSNSFIYQKSGKIYYFSLKDYFSGKSLSEDWRFIGESSLKKTSWTDDGTLIWVEKNIVYQSYPEQFYYRSIYKHYLRQGIVLCKIPFDFDPASDTLQYNKNTGRLFVVKQGISISYYSIDGLLTANPYLQLNDTMRFDKVLINSNGDGAFTVKVLKNGSIEKQLILITRDDNTYQFTIFKDTGTEAISNINFSHDMNSIFVSTDKGVFSILLSDKKVEWNIELPDALEVVETETGEYIFFCKDFIWKGRDSDRKPLFLSSGDFAGFYKGQSVIYAKGKFYIIDDVTSRINEISLAASDLYTVTTNGMFRLLSREVKKGFYTDSLIIKEIYTGKQYDITSFPQLYYSLYQPEISGDFSFLDTPVSEKSEVALLFDGVKTSEGIFDILSVIEKYQIKANFFLNGNFMEINPVITTEISKFNLEVGNAFQYHVNLLENKFMIDRNFIRQGLSANEESYFKLSGKNFSPYWHAPYFVYSESIIKYGLESGYRFVSYNLDSLDWVSKSDRQLSASYFMNNEQLIERILKRLKPNQVISLSSGKNDIIRDQWLFYDIETLITEMIRSGYSFSFVSTVIDKYRVK